MSSEEKVVPLNRFDYALQLCTSVANKHTAPFTRPDGLVYATNSFLCIRMDPGLAARKYEEGDTKAEGVFEKENTVEAEQRVLDIRQLMALCAQHGLYIDRHRNCEACGGHGEDECWHCGSMAECNDCGGSGKKGSADPIRQVQFSESTMKLDGWHFTPALLHTVSLVGLMMGDEKIVFEISGQKAFITYGNGVEMILMLQHKPD